MSSVTTLLQSQSTSSFPTTAFTHTCQKCGADLSQSHTAIAEDAQRRISELEAQVKILTGKATAAGTLPLPFLLRRTQCFRHDTTINHE